MSFQDMRPKRITDRHTGRPKDCIHATYFVLQTLVEKQVLAKMKKVNKQCLLDTPRTVRVSEKTWQVIV